MAGEGFELGGGGGRLVADICGGGAWAEAPMVEYFWEVNDLTSMLTQAEKEVPILGAIQLWVKAADVAEEGEAGYGEVGEVIGGEEQLGRPIGLEQGAAALAIDGGEQVMIGVEQVAIGCGGDGAGDFPKGVGSQRVVLIEEGDELALGNFQGSVRIAGDALVALQPDHGEAGVQGGVLLEELVHTRAVGGTVGEAGLPVGVGLGEEGIEGGGKIAGAGVVYGDDDADGGAEAEAGELLSLTEKLSFVWLEGLDPARIFDR